MEFPTPQRTTEEATRGLCAFAAAAALLLCAKSGSSQSSSTVVATTPLAGLPVRFPLWGVCSHLTGQH